ncbi:MAG: RAMP superfamily protein [Anaerolineae bacterium]|nr:RAMP superfamily protein [Anaerolineae bacterium]
MYLRIELLSDTAFGRGDGIASHVNSEIEHDKATGLPIIKGRTLKGLFVEACADILYGLQQCAPSAHKTFDELAKGLFGTPGSRLDSMGKLNFGTATLPADFIAELDKLHQPKETVLNTLTTIRHQTAVDDDDKPKDTSLRATRVVLKGTIFHAHISHPDLDDDETALLWACANTVRNAGQNRTRGLGHIRITLCYDNFEPIWGCDTYFADIVKGHIS